MRIIPGCIYISCTWLSVALLLAVFCLSVPVTQAQSLGTEMDRYLAAAEEILHFSGVAFVARDGKVIYNKGYGLANYELNIPNNPQMKFRIGSITKQFTSTAIMQLQERGLLDINDPITRHLPDYSSEPGDRITIHHLLTHTSGIPSYTGIPDVMKRRAVEISLEDLIATFKDLSLEFEPGEQWRYSNSGYILLGAIVEAVSGMPYDQYLNERIFTPLGMANTGYDHNQILLQNRASGYSIDSSGQLINTGYVHASVSYAAGALYSNVGDLLIWDQALYTDKVLTRKSLATMFTPVMQNYGYGWVIDEMYGHKCVMHGGGIDGFVTMFCRYVDDNVCVAVLSNNDSAPAPRIAHALAAIVFGAGYDVPVIKTAIEIDTALYHDYTGVYEVEENTYRYIILDKGKLYSQRTGSSQIQIFPESEDKFFFNHDNSVTLTFVRDETGKVVKHIIRQFGEDQPAPRLTGKIGAKLMTEKLEAEKPASDIDPAVYDDYVGEYELMPGFTITVTREGDQIFIQATGQDKFEIYPKSETKFFLKVVDAQIEFVRDNSGVVNELILFQGGQAKKGKRIK